MDYWQVIGWVALASPLIMAVTTYFWPVNSLERHGVFMMYAGLLAAYTPVVGIWPGVTLFAGGAVLVAIAASLRALLKVLVQDREKMPHAIAEQIHFVLWERDQRLGDGR